MGVAERTIAVWLAEGMPGVPGAYCVEDCKAWKAAKGDRRKPGDDDDDDATVTAAQSPNLERLRKYKALQERDKYRIQHGALIPADIVQRMMQHAAGVIRTFSEKLGRSHPELQVEFEQMLDQVGGLVDAIVDGDDSHTDYMAGNGKEPIP